MLFGIPIGKSGIACKIGKIPTKSGKLACMEQLNFEVFKKNKQQFGIENFHLPVINLDHTHTARINIQKKSLSKFDKELEDYFYFLICSKA